MSTAEASSGPTFYVDLPIPDGRSLTATWSVDEVVRLHATMTSWLALEAHTISAKAIEAVARAWPKQLLGALAALDESPHVLVCLEESWHLEHPLPCRVAGLATCEFTVPVAESMAARRREPGRWIVTAPDATALLAPALMFTPTEE